MGKVQNPLRGDQLPIPGIEAPTEPPAPKLKSWCSGKEALERLEISYDKLKRLRRAGTFKEGHHYRDLSAPGAARPTYQYHVPRIEALLSGKAAKRKKYA